MKWNKTTTWSFIFLILVAALYRIWEDRPMGFAPHMAMALFGGAVIKDKRFAIILPLVSLLISDALYQLLYQNGLTPYSGFYKGQWVIYLIFLAITFFGMLMKKINFKNVLGFTLSGSLIFFLLSNFSVWMGNGGLGRPRTFEGLLQCYGDAIAFYRDYGVIKGFYGNMFICDLFFSAVLFGGYALVKQGETKTSLRTA